MYLYSRPLDPSVVNCARKLSNKKEFEPLSRKEGVRGGIVSYLIFLKMEGVQTYPATINIIWVNLKAP